VAVKEGGKEPRFPPRGAFVVVVVVAADKKRGGNGRDWRRQSAFRRRAATGVTATGMVICDVEIIDALPYSYNKTGVISGLLRLMS